MIGEPRAPAARAKVDRDEVFIEYTKSICPLCKAVVDAQVNVRDGRVYLRKRCREHGEFEALVYGDAAMYMDSLRFNKPGTIPLELQTEVVDGCPLDCGLCPDHRQHACLGIIEVNTGCNLDCPICFADSGHQPDGYTLSLEQVDRMLDAFVASEGEAEVVMVSGGEPTIHPDILAILELCRSKCIATVTLNTNGLRLASDAAFVDRLAELGIRVYLQFDGLRESTHRAIRGRDLRERKRRALDACARAGLTVTLAAAVDRGVNEDEIGDIIRLGVEHPSVRAVALQPTTHAGRHPEFDPMTRLTNSDVIHLVAEQLPEWFRASDFFPAPCCFPSCRSISYCLVDGGSVLPLSRIVSPEEHLDYLSNRVMPDPRIRTALERLYSASATPGSAQLAEELECATCGIDLPAALRDLSEKAFMIVVQDFQDPYTLNVRQLMKCCVVEIVPDGRLIPFCAYNSVGYREQVRERLSGVGVPALVPNARPVRHLLEPTRYGSTTLRGDAARGHVTVNATNTGRSLRSHPADSAPGHRESAGAPG